jgi:ferredoxin
LRPPTPAYVAAPRVDSSTCVAGDGCSTCVDICPQGAYQWSDGRISYDKDACVPCGRCVTSAMHVDDPQLLVRGVPFARSELCEGRVMWRLRLPGRWRFPRDRSSRHRPKDAHPVRV